MPKSIIYRCPDYIYRLCRCCPYSISTSTPTTTSHPRTPPSGQSPFIPGETLLSRRRGDSSFADHRVPLQSHQDITHSRRKTTAVVSVCMCREVPTKGGGRIRSCCWTREYDLSFSSRLSGSVGNKSRFHWCTGSAVAYTLSRMQRHGLINVIQHHWH